MAVDAPALKLPQRQSLEQQTAVALREAIARGTWKDWLPGERGLCDMLQISRHTLRAALGQLREDGTVFSVQGVGHRVATGSATTGSKALAAQEVGLLIPGDLEELLPTQVMWIDHLRAMLAERGCRLHLFHGRKFAQRDPARALQRLLARHDHRCWILLLSGEPVQKWFERQKVPCLVAGSIYAGVNLPYCDLDHHASCRHAAGGLLGRGHRKVALVIQKSRRAGDIESEAGFTEGIAKSSHPDAEVMIAYHEATAASITNALKRLMHRAPAPTALLVVNPFHYLSVVTSLAKMGLRVPDDISVVSRDGELYMNYLVPSPTHYRIEPKKFAKALLVPVLQLLAGRAIAKHATHIMPEFNAGQSVGSRT
ncbi:substrate-binding domain-containing protein [Oleiharenicola lentus]|uniref:substrate-binding domain-containing protein n=1 Tax=Oleiharenicola lentus TaxID=2508720 RepID=UPI003F67B8D7